MRSPWDRDPELEAMFEDEGLLETAELIRAVPHHRPDPDPAFRMDLRRRLMREAWDRVETAQPGLSWWRRLFRPPAMAWMGATVGVLLIAVAVFTVATNPSGGTEQVTLHSPLANAQRVGLVQPITLTFNQPMDQASVESSLSIKPATKVDYRWQGNTLKITPVNGLAPNTQYQVTVAPDAKTQAGQSLGAQPAVKFVTAPPPPSPTPTPTATPSPSALPVSGERRLASAGAAPAAWAADASALYVVGPDGRLSSVPLTGGSPTTIAPDGVTAVATGPDGVAYVRGGDLVYGRQTVAGAKPLAIGFRSGRLVYLSGRSVSGLDGSQLATLADDPQAAVFSPGGDRLAYLAASGLHLVDLATGKDSAAGPATALGAWSPDGRRFAYLSGSAVVATDGASVPARLASGQGVSGLSWSAGDQLLLSGSSSLRMVNADGSGLTTLATGAYEQAQWAPGGAGFSFKRSGGIWVARVSDARPAPAQPSQESVVDAFMTARKAGDRTTSLGYLDAAGQAAFANGLTLVYSSPRSLSRYYVLLSQPGRATVRLVIQQGPAQLYVDETLTIVRDATGKPVIHGVAETPPQPLGAGPDVLGVQVTASQVKVTFDSDLDPGTLSGVTIQGVAAQAAYDAASRTVTLTVPGGLSAGTAYQLAVTPALKDVGGQPAAGFQLAFTGPPATP